MVAAGLAICRNPAAIASTQAEELRSHRYSDREIVDVVGVVALNVLTGAFNLIAGLEPERPAEAPEVNGANSQARTSSPATETKESRTP